MIGQGPQGLIDETFMSKSKPKIHGGTLALDFSNFGQADWHQKLHKIASEVNNWWMASTWAWIIVTIPLINKPLRFNATVVALTAKD